MMAADLADVSFATIYIAVKRGKIKSRVELIQRLRVRLKDVRAYKKGMKPEHIARGKKGMARRKELNAFRFTKTAIPRGRKLVNHPGPRKVGSHDLSHALPVDVSRDLGTESGPSGPISDA